MIAPHRPGRQESGHKKQMEVIREGDGLDKGEQPSQGKNMAKVQRKLGRFHHLASPEH